jgi:hypothetical protein
MAEKSESFAIHRMQAEPSDRRNGAKTKARIEYLLSTYSLTSLDVTSIYNCLQSHTKIPGLFFLNI